MPAMCNLKIFLDLHITFSVYPVEVVISPVVSPRHASRMVRPLCDIKDSTSIVDLVQG